MRRIVALSVYMFASLFGTAGAQQSLIGAWEVQDIEISGDPETVSDRKPGLYLFTQEHLSIVFASADIVESNTPPAPTILQGADGNFVIETNSESNNVATATFEGFSSGRYQQNGNIIRFSASVAADSNLLDRDVEMTFVFEGRDRLVLTRTNEQYAQIRTILSRVVNSANR